MIIYVCFYIFLFICGVFIYYLFCLVWYVFEVFFFESVACVSVGLLYFILFVFVFYFIYKKMEWNYGEIKIKWENRWKCGDLW